MVRISQHKQQQKKELKEANIKVKLNKHNFSPEFAKELYEFSEKHHKDHFKEFNKALEVWTQDHQSEIAAEIAKGECTEEMIYDKIKISARFYYRKKSKKEEKEKEKEQSHKKKKLYIGLSQTFIIVMDEFIKDELLSRANNNKRKTSFAKFTQMNLEHIKDELIILKKKYDEQHEQYEPREISNKLKKAFDNRFYTFTGQL